jgi:uncharacterized repeat protein (TIGR02543 family)
MANSIIYDNGGNYPIDDSSGTTILYKYNSIIQAQTASSTNVNPQFTDSANYDFTLQATSPAKDTGNNTYATAPTDLLGNHRVFNTTVDMGPYEFGSSVGRSLTTSSIKGTISADVQPVNGLYTNGTVVVLTATPDTGYQFDGWSGDATGNTNPLSVPMDANKSITAAFSLIPAVQRTLTINTTNGTVTTNPNPTNGTYDEGTVVGLTATPAAGYQFNGWSGDATGNTNPLNLTMDADKTVTATFSPIQHTLTLNGTNGSITASPNPVNGTYAEGTVVTLTSNPDANYEFLNWGGDYAGASNTNTSASITITMDADKDITAYFGIIYYELSITANTQGTVTPSAPDRGSVDYISGSNVTLTATPNTGYEFDRWSGDVVGTANPISFTMDADKSITALFSPIQRTLTINATNGSVTSNPNPVNGTYNNGTVVNLTATPDSGYQFDGWSGDATGSTTSLSLTMDEDKTVTALFSLIQRKLTINATNGNVNVTGAANSKSKAIATDFYFNHGETTSMTAVPDAGYQFDGWSDDATGSTNPLNITMDADKTVTALFSPIQRTLTIIETNGTITVNPNSITNNTGTYDDGTIVSLTAIPDSGYQFDGWSDDATGSTNPLSITMDADKTVTALFSPIQRTLTIIETNGTITVNPNPNSITNNTGTYDDGTVVSLTAIPDSGYQFDGWSDDATGITNPINITMDANKTVTAMFSLIQRTLTINAVNGTVTTNLNPVNGTYDNGTVVTLTATPNSGYGFTNWSGDVTGTTNVIMVTLDGDKTIDANFSTTASIIDADKINISVYPNPISNFITIQLDEKIKIGKILDVTGKEIKTFYKNKINTSDISSGIYILQIESESGKIAIKKIIKN